MAEDEKTPETEETPDSIQEEVETAASEEGAGDTSTVDAPEETPAEEAPAPAAEAAAPRGAAGGAGAQGAPRRAAAPPRRPPRPAPRPPRSATPSGSPPASTRPSCAATTAQRAKTKEAERKQAEPAREPDAAPEHGPGRAKVRQGIVVSDKADKTIVVRVDVTRRHRRYGKIMRTSSKLHAHDERNDAGTGDTVRVVECRPMSRTKRWRLTDVLEKAK